MPSTTPSPRHSSRTVDNCSAVLVAESAENLIAGYHEQALNQAKVQFWFSVFAATVGFAWILYAGTGIDTPSVTTALKTLPGAIVDLVAFLFFRQAAETRQRATDLYDRLRADKQSTEVMELVASIEDVTVKSAVQAQIALHKAGLAPTPIDLMRFLITDAGGAVVPASGHRV